MREYFPCVSVILVGQSEIGSRNSEVVFHGTKKANVCIEDDSVRSCSPSIKKQRGCSQLFTYSSGTSLAAYDGPALSSSYLCQYMCAVSSCSKMRIDFNSDFFNFSAWDGADLGF